MGDKKIHVQAHRGACAEFVENTLPSFQRAVQLKVDSIELDVHLTLEGEVVVYHDFELIPECCFDSTGKPITAPVPIWQIRLEDLQKLETRVDRRLLVKRPLAAEEKKIPTLKEVCQKVNEWSLSLSHPIVMDVEIKRQESLESQIPSAREMVKQVVSVLKQYWHTQRSVVRSFDLSILQEMRSQAPELELGLLTYQPETSPLELCGKYRPKIWAPYFRETSREQIDAVKSLGVEVIPYTVNAPRDFSAMIAAGVSGMTTDNPEALLQFLNRSKMG
jgi:glycerophosphoryl diester phosphodiesterase